jgi:hypothetical protein
VRVRQEIRRSAIGFDRCFVEITGNGEKAFSPEDQPLLSLGSQLARRASARAPATAFDRTRMIHRPVALCATRFVEPGEHSDAFQQRRFAGTVFTYDDSNGPFEIKAEAVFE